MNVKSLCLAILAEGEATGYEIRKLSTEGKFAYFVEASFGSIYPALAKLQAEGLVTVRVVTQDGRPAKKLYALTESGHAAFIAMLHEPLADDVFRSEFLLFSFYAKHLPRSLVRQRIAERLERFDTEIARVRDMQDKIHAKGCHQWTADFGLACLEFTRTYLITHQADLIAEAQDDNPALAAE